MSGSNDDSLRSENHKVLHEMLRRLGTQDYSGACELLTPDVICDWPYPPVADGPTEIRGRHRIEKFFSIGMSNFDPYRYEITRVFDLVDPNQLIAEYHSQSRFKPSDAPYRNDYLSIFQFDGGLVSHWREYVNPLVISEILASAGWPPQ